MKVNAKVKALSLAVVGLAGYAFAGSVFAACTASNLSVWSSTSALGGTVTVATGGLETTSPSECRLDAAITTNGPGVNAFVRDNTPAGETRYRAQFLINTDALTSMNSTQSVKVFGATTETPANGLADLVKLTVFGNLQGTSRNLGIFTACQGQSGSQCTDSIPLVAGVNTVEIDWVKGNPGSLKVWLNSNTEGTPTKTIATNSASWTTGVDFATLGLAAPSANYRTAQLNHVVKFDRFDSRRQTFIGF